MTTAIQTSERSPCELNTPYSPREFWLTKSLPEKGALLVVSSAKIAWSQYYIYSNLIKDQEEDPDYGKLEMHGITLYDRERNRERVSPALIGKKVCSINIKPENETTSHCWISVVTKNYFELLDTTRAALPSDLSLIEVDLILDYLS
jgi:hypothetical protein